jgi:energy-converting hydrogenase Eha subunit A
MTPSVQHALVTIVILALIAWRLQSRMRRMIGRQRLSPVRPWITLVIFPLLVAMLGYAALQQQHLGVYLASGIVVGIGLGVLGLRLTRFEVTTEGLYYTPSAHLGVALSVLLLCRIAYRFAVGGFPDPGASAASAPPGAGLTPLTLLLIGTLAGYYTSYAIGLIRWSLRNRGLARSASDSGTV